MKRTITLMPLLAAVAVCISCAGISRSMSPVDCYILTVGSEEFNYAIKQYNKVKSDAWKVTLGGFISSIDNATADWGRPKAMIARMNYSWVHQDKNVYKLRSLWKQKRMVVPRSRTQLKERMICLEVLIVVDPKTDELLETDPKVEIYTMQGECIDRYVGNGAWQFMSRMNSRW